MIPSRSRSAWSRIGEESHKTDDVAGRQQYKKIHCHRDLRRIGFVEESTRARGFLVTVQ
jgi:hypothetical protein